MKKITKLSIVVSLMLFIQACEKQEVQPGDTHQAKIAKIDLDDQFSNFDETNRRIVNYVAHLSGNHEVPAAETMATGQVKFQLNQDGSELYYKLIVANIVNVRFSHIHMAPAGSNGPIVVFLYPGPTLDDVDGILAEGTITEADLTGPLAGQTLSDLISAINNEQTYVNVHTDQYPGGEIRGQIQ